MRAFSIDLWQGTFKWDVRPTPRAEVEHLINDHLAHLLRDDPRRLDVVFEIVDLDDDREPLPPFVRLRFTDARDSRVDRATGNLKNVRTTHLTMQLHSRISALRAACRMALSPDLGDVDLRNVRLLEGFHLLKTGTIVNVERF